MVVSVPLCHGILFFPVVDRGSSAHSRRWRLVLAAGCRSVPTATASTDAAPVADPAHVGRRRYS
jgi:hypothetical protein